MTSWFPDFGTCRTLLSPVSNLMREGLVLPSSWSFDDIPIRTIREFWKALLTLAMIHLGVAFRLTGWQDVGMIQLLVKPRDALINWIADGVGIRREIVVRLLDLHSYNRSSKTPDIAIAPFLPLGNDRIAASPWMLTSSSWERNFCACAARTCPALYNSTDGPLAQSLGKELVSVFEKAGFKAAHGLKFKRKGIEGDIDLLVWSPNESYVLAVELYWKIAAGDIMEVLGGEKTCLEKFGRQLPKYQKELSEEAGDLVARAFSLKSRPVVTGWSCGLAARGFVGTPRIENEQYFFVPESLFRKEVLNHKSLKGFCKWANAKSFLPQEGRDFTMSPVDVTSPSGIHVRFWEADSV